MGQVVEQIAGNPVPFYVLANQVKQFKGEVLSIHATDDKEVAYKDGYAIGGAGDHVTHVPFDGLGHRRIVADRKVFETLKAFVGADAKKVRRAA
jgi:hypothetical protein